MEFSALHRAHFLERLKQESFDLVIIGGGITGCGIALDAAARGLRVALLEKNDFAYGTSSKSTKLIHGGLRYLKQLEFGLVKEVGSERAVVHHLAPHLVVPEKMLLPLYEKKGLGYWLTSFGLKVYDWLAGVKPEDQRRMLTRSQTLKKEPLLREHDVKGGALYAEYRTDDARLTIEIAKAAAKHGALVINYVSVKDFILSEEKLSGVIAEDTFTQEVFEVRAKVVVNASGPWVDDLRKINNSLFGKKLQLTKGVHIVVPKDRLPVRQAIYFDVEDGRMIFAIPRGRVTYIGTTDTVFSADKDAVCTLPEDARYLINAVNNTFPGINLAMADIESSWAGLRPLIYEEGKEAHNLSRKDEIFESPSGLISIAGGKLTGYRKMAERVVSLVIRKYFPALSDVPCTTAKIRLAGGAFEEYDDVNKLKEDLKVMLAPFRFEGYVIDQMVENFGYQCQHIVSEFLLLQNTQSPPILSLLKAQLRFCFRHEMVNTLSDFVVRRTGLLLFDIGHVNTFAPDLCNELAALLNWDFKRIDEEQQHLQRLTEEAQIKNEQYS